MSKSLPWRKQRLSANARSAFVSEVCQTAMRRAGLAEPACANMVLNNGSDIKLKMGLPRDLEH